MIFSCFLWPEVLSEGGTLCLRQWLHICEGQHLDVPLSCKQHFMGNKKIFYVLLFPGLELIFPSTLPEGMSKTKGDREVKSHALRELPGDRGTGVHMSSATDLLLSRSASLHQFFSSEPQCPWDTNCACIILLSLATAGCMG